MPPPKPKPKQTRVAVDLWRKQEVLRWVAAEGGGVPTRAVKHFRARGWAVDGGAVRKWWRARADILAADPKGRRLPGAGRKKAVTTAASAPAATSVATSMASSAAPGSIDSDTKQQQPQAVPTTPILADETALREDQQQQQEEEQQEQEEDGEGLAPAERAVLLLQRRYSGRLPDADVVEAFDVMLDPMKARMFLVMAPGEQRDLWLRRQIERSRQRVGRERATASQL